MENFDILLKFYIRIFHVALLFIIFWTSVYYFLKHKTRINFFFLLGFFFLGAFRPIIYVTENSNFWYLHANALFIDLAAIFIFIAFIMIQKKHYGKKTG